MTNNEKEQIRGLVWDIKELAITAGLYSNDVYAKYAGQTLRNKCDKILKLLEPTRRKG